MTQKLNSENIDEQQLSHLLFPLHIVGGHNICCKTEKAKIENTKNEKNNRLCNLMYKYDFGNIQNIREDL